MIQENFVAEMSLRDANPLDGYDLPETWYF